MYPLNDARILIVEDDPGTAALQKRAVERAGYQVVTTATAEDALSILRGTEITLILLDNRLPGEMSGLDFLANLRSYAPEMPVIMVSGSEAEGAVIQALRSGVRDFIRKDIDYLQYLPQAIAAVLRRARLEAQLRERLPAHRTLLIVERSAGAAELEKRHLERAGFHVLTAANPEQALQLIQQDEIGLLIVDREAGGSGVGLYSRMRASGPDIPAILLTPPAIETIVIEALRAGFRDVVLQDGDYLSALQESVHRVSERARLEAQVSESKTRLAGIVSSAMDAIMLLDEQLRITIFNPAAEQIFRTPAAQALGEVMTRFIPSITENIPLAGPGTISKRFEAEGHCGDASKCALDISLASMESGGRRFISVIARDVTDRKELERLLLQKDKLESLGLLAGGIAHDFNNLLVGILGNASLALETISTNNPARALLRDVVLASETAGNLTRQLLAYAGKGRFLIEPVDLSELVRQISNLLQTSIPKNIQLRLDLADNLPSVEADITQLQQLVMNLVINGSEAIGDTQGTIFITTAVQHVDEDYIGTVLSPAQVSPGMYINLQVHDTGAGMSQETIDKIFDPFFTTKFTGRGLGLAAVLGIVSGHRGAIKVYSTLGQGTTFKVLLPAGEHQVIKHEAPPPVERSVEGETVLVVDDEQIVRRSAKAMLERYGYTVVLAENGKQAVDLYRVLADKIQIVLLDMTMPVMSGEETFRQLKMIRPDVCVVLSSGYNEAEAVRRFTGKGLAGFVQKPYSAVTLAEKIRALLREKRGTAQS